MGDDRTDAGPEAAPDPYASMIETHTGVVVLVGDRAFKLKKPLRYGFLDFTTLESRERACAREVVLNRRLAPDVYLGVAQLRGPDGAVWEHLVVMRRLPSRRALSRLATRHQDLGAVIEQVAAELARFHDAAERSVKCDRSASAEVTLERWRANGAGMMPLVGPLFDADLHDEVLRLAARYIEGRRRLFAARIAAGRVCDGHGDLLADDVFCLDDGLRVLDCLEFDDALRCGDVLGDVCSLAMDLEDLGRADLGRTLLDAYELCSGDHWPASLAHHYTAYRAHVRALVAGLRFDQGAREAKERARALMALCHAHLEAGRVRLLVVGGAPGTGKTTVAGWAADALDATLLRSDVIRKTVVGLDPDTPAPAPFRAGLYRPAATATTYRELIRLAREELAMGRSVVLDATFADPAWRAEVRRIAAESSSDLDELRCVAPPEVTHPRLVDRSATAGDASDADPAVASELERRAQPWPEAAELDTDAPLEAVRHRLARLLGTEGPPK